MNDNIFRYGIKTTAKWRCKLAKSCGIVMSFTITDTGFNPVLDLSKAPMFFQVLFASFGAAGKDSYAVYLGINILLIMC